MQHAPSLAETPSERPSRAQIEPAALAILSRHSAGLLATARRYSVCPEDAEDAYQRGVEILLTKAPTTHEDELLPWLKTVVKHEAFAVRKLSGQAWPAAAAGVEEPDAIEWTDERAERYERLRVGAEAMANLKPQEIRCLLLRAEGLSYKEICAATGWTYTKVNRSITEGRRAFLKRVASIETGAECDLLAPLISKVSDGEASGAEMRQVRPHIKNCLACKATLREYRAAPGRLAGLVPVVALAGGGAGAGGPLGWFARVLQAVQVRAGAIGDLPVAQKAAAVAASAAVLAGGGAAGVEAIHHDAPRVPRAAFAASSGGTERIDKGGTTAPVTSADPAGTLPSRPDSASSPIAYSPPPTERAGSSDAAPASDNAAPSTSAGTGQPEFDPGTATAAPAAESPDSVVAPAPAKSASPPAEFGP